MGRGFWNPFRKYSKCVVFSFVYFTLDAVYRVKEVCHFSGVHTMSLPILTVVTLVPLLFPISWDVGFEKPRPVLLV